MSATLKGRTKMRARLFVEDELNIELAAGLVFTFNSDHSHYLRAVLRAEPGQVVLVFNGRDGEWLCELTQVGKKEVQGVLQTQTRVQTPPSDTWLLFAPLKKDAMNYAVEKASELGAGRIQPVITRYTQSERIRLDRLQAVAIEASEQCESLTRPQLDEPKHLIEVLQNWPDDRQLLVCAEVGEVRTPILKALEQTSVRIALLIGPEGGWHEDELAAFTSHPAVTAVSLGSRILRAETAVAVALGAVALRASTIKSAS